MPEPHPLEYALRLLKLGLIVVENEQDKIYTFYRPMGLRGTSFPRLEEGTHHLLNQNVFVRVDAPSASLFPIDTGEGRRWVVDMSMAAAPGPGPVWFHEEFASAEEAVAAIRDCYFGDRIDFRSASLGWYRSNDGA